MTQVFSVLLTKVAENNLEEIFDYIARYDSPESANYVLSNLQNLVLDLTQNPERGSFPKELLELGIKEYRQVFFKSYRVIYRILANQVIVYLIADGRRDMQTLLERQLLIQ